MYFFFFNRHPSLDILQHFYKDILTLSCPCLFASISHKVAVCQTRYHGLPACCEIRSMDSKQHLAWDRCRGRLRIDGQRRDVDEPLMARWMWDSVSTFTALCWSESISPATRHQQQHLSVSSSVCPASKRCSAKFPLLFWNRSSGKTQHHAVIYRPTAGGSLRDLFCGKYNAAPRIENKPRKKKVAKKERSVGFKQYFQRLT